MRRLLPLAKWAYEGPAPILMRDEQRKLIQLESTAGLRQGGSPPAPVTTPSLMQPPMHWAADLAATCAALATPFSFTRGSASHPKLAATW